MNSCPLDTATTVLPSHEFQSSRCWAPSNRVHLHILYRRVIVCVMCKPSQMKDCVWDNRKPQHPACICMLSKGQGQWLCFCMQDVPEAEASLLARLGLSWYGSIKLDQCPSTGVGAQYIAEPSTVYICKTLQTQPVTVVATGPSQHLSCCLFSFRLCLAHHLLHYMHVEYVGSTTQTTTIAT